MPSFGKELMLQELVRTLQSKSYVFFARHQGLSATDFVELRRKLEKVADRTLVAKNSITRLAFKQIGIKEVNGFIKGSMFLTVAQKDPHLISKILVDFAKGREGLQLDGAYLEGAIVPVEYLKSLAELPSREVLLASVAGSMRAPMSGLVYVLSQLIRSFTIALDQIQKSKGN